MVIFKFKNYSHLAIFNNNRQNKCPKNIIFSKKFLIVK